MASTGKIDNILDRQAIEKEFAWLIEETKATVGKLEKISADAKVNFAGVSGAGNINQLNAQMNETNNIKARGVKVSKELTDNEIKLKQAETETMRVRKQTIASTNEQIGAYARLNAELAIARKRAQDLAAEYGNKSKAAKQAAKEVQELDKRVKDIDYSLGQHQKNVGNYPKFLGGLKTAWVGVAGAISGAIALTAGVVAFFKSSVEGAMDDEKAEGKLMMALDNSKKKFEEYIKLKEKYWKGTTFSEDEVYNALNFAAAMGRTAEQADKMLTAAAGLAKVTGTDLNTAMMALNGTMEGNLGKLGKYDAHLKDLTKEQLASGAAIDLLSAKLGKFATADINTSTGAVDRFKKAVEAMKDAIGNATLRWLGFMDTVGPKNKVGVEWQKFMAQDEEGRKKLIAEWEKNRKLYESNQMALMASGKQSKGRTEAGILADEMRELIQRGKEYNEIKNAGALQDPKVTSGIEKQTDALEEYKRQIWEIDQLFARIDQKLSGESPVSMNAGGMGIQTGLSMPKGLEKITNPEPEDPEERERKKVEAERQAWIEREQIASEFAGRISAIGNEIFAASLEKISEEKQRIEEKYDREIELAHGNKKKIKQLQDAKAKELAEQTKKEKKIQHDQAVFQIIMNTAMAAMKDLSQYGFILGSIFAALDIAFGVIQLANLPKLKSGRKGGPATFAHVSEEGQEVMVTKSGQVVPLPTKESIAFIPEGASVIPHDQLLSMAGKASMQRLSGFDGLNEQMNLAMLMNGGFGLVANTIKNKKEVSIDLKDGELRKVVISGALREEYLNKNIRL